MLPLMPLGSLVLALRELSMSFIRFANDFLGLLSRQAHFRFELEPDKFAVLFVWIHLSHLLSGTCLSNVLRRLKRG